MNNYLKLLLFLMLSCKTLIAQNYVSENEIIKQVFDKLVLAYGSAKAAPSLEIINKNEIQNSPAVYSASPSPVIRIDIHLYKLCEKLGKDKLNALSIIISHELAHFYNDHTFCNDFAFGIRDENNDLSVKLKSIAKSERLVQEMEADYKGLFYSCMAGFNPFGIYSIMLDEIYTAYNLPDTFEGYPSKEERKDINIEVQGKINQLYSLFLDALAASENGDYNMAIDKFNELNKYFPSRENYNNIGVIKCFKALQYWLPSKEILKFHKKFEYPLRVDKNSRLKQPMLFKEVQNNDTMSMMKPLLKSAQKDFEEAIRLDSNYTISYINLACVFDMLGNPHAAIGKIFEVQNYQNNQNALQVLEIAYYNLGELKKVEEVREMLKIYEMEKF